MSLIGKALTELENKMQQSEPEQKKVLSGLNPAIQNFQTTHKRGWIKKVFLVLITILLAVIAGRQIYKYIYNPHARSVNLPKPVVVSNQTTLAIQSEITESKPINLENIALNVVNNATVLNFFLTGNTYYYIDRTNNPQQIMITLGNTILPGNLPVALDKSVIASLATKQNAKDVEITLNLAPNIEIAGLQFITAPKPHLQLTLSSPPGVTTSISKIERVAAPEVQAADKYQIALGLLAQNQTKAAINQLYLLIGDFPAQQQARELLATLIYKSGDAEKAIALLDVGLKKSPGYIPFIKLKAEILTTQGNITKALALLEKNPPTINEDPEYIALLAVLYQQNGKYMQAAELYYQLAKYNPDKGTWWLGLGVALESANKRNAAIEAFKHAINCSDLSPELLAYATSKVK